MQPLFAIDQPMRNSVNCHSFYGSKSLAFTCHLISDTNALLKKHLRSV